MRKKITLIALFVLLAALITLMTVQTKRANNFYADFSGKGKQPIRAAKLLAQYGDSAVWDKKTRTLTLNNVHFSGTGSYVITLPKNATLELVGENSINGTVQKNGNAAALVGLGDLTVTGPGSLILQGSDTGEADISAGMILNGNLLMKSGRITAEGGSYGVYAPDGTVEMENEARLEAGGDEKAIEAREILLPEDWEEPGEIGQSAVLAQK